VTPKVFRIGDWKLQKSEDNADQGLCRVFFLISGFATGHTRPTEPKWCRQGPCRINRNRERLEMIVHSESSSVSASRPSTDIPSQDRKALIPQKQDTGNQSNAPGPQNATEWVLQAVHQLPAFKYLIGGDATGRDGCNIPLTCCRQSSLRSLQGNNRFCRDVLGPNLSSI
jgi:hypothetical protein